MFKTINELISIIDRKKLKPIQIINPQKRRNYNKSTNSTSLYKAIKQNKVTNNNQAARFLNFKNPSDKGYLMALSRLKNNLLNSLFFLETTSFPNNYAKHKSKAFKHLYLGKLLSLLGAFEIAQKQFQKAILAGKKYDIPDIIEDSMLHYLSVSSRIGKGTYFKKYTEQYENISKRVETLKFGEFNLSIIVQITFASVDVSNSDRTILEKKFKQLKSLKNKWKDLRIEEIKFQGKIYKNQLEHDFRSLTANCKKFLSFIDNHPNSRDKHYKLCIHLMLLGLLNNKDFKQGKKLYDSYINKFDKGTINTIHYSEIYFLICMNTKKYQEAKKIFNSVVANKKFKSLPSIVIEEWTLYKLYVALTTKNQDIVLKSTDFDLPKYAKDKTGRNVQIIIAQVLLLLKEKNYDEIIEKLNTLKLYRQRYLKKRNDAFVNRSSIFIKALLNIVNTGFNKKQMEKIKTNSCNRLKIYENKNLDLSKSFEVIPYEELLDIILELDK